MLNEIFAAYSMRKLSYSADGIFSKEATQKAACADYLRAYQKSNPIAKVNDTIALYDNNIGASKILPGTPTHYLARAGKFRRIFYDPKHHAWEYPIRTAFNNHECETQEDLDDYIKKLPLIVPGLKVVDAALIGKRTLLTTCAQRGYIWFTWDRESMLARYREVFKEFGVADERLAYMKCGGTVEPKKGQLRLSNVVVKNKEAWTSYGIMQIDKGFCHRIRDPNVGGPEAYPFNRMCIVGNEWWYVGSRGDSKEIMELEIQASPLDNRTQENLLYNLSNYRDNGLTDSD